MKIKNEARLIGILGTLILHLIAGIIFVSFKIDSIKKGISKDIIVEFAPSEQPPQIVEAKITVPATSVEKILSGDEKMLNIARNLANKSEAKIDPSEYIDMVKEELIKSGQLNENNYIDRQKRLAEQGPDEDIPSADKNKEKTKPEETKKSQEMAANYKGPTRIYYDLEGRTHTHLPVPIYKCPGSGKVVLAIEVNQKGLVENAKILEGESTALDPCLLETAVNTALISRFNADLKSPKIQKGTLSYQFVAQ